MSTVVISCSRWKEKQSMRIMSKAERKLPQWCFCHPRNDYRSFRPDEGRFINNFSAFICYDCLAKQGRHRQATAAFRTSPLEGEAVQALRAAGFRFQYQFTLGRYRFDLAFPRQRLLIELDGKSWHNSRRSRARDACKQRYAESEGWRVVHIPNGPGLFKRIVDAIAGTDAAERAKAASI